MRRKEIALIALCFLIISIACQEKFAERDFPSVITSNIFDRGALGIEFSGELILRGTKVPDEIGFIWQNDEDPGIYPGYRIDLPGVIKTGKFSVLIKTSLKKDSKYFVRAYARSVNTMIYGDLFMFISPVDFVPGITSITPMTGLVGDTITIKGGTLNSDASKIIVRFNTIDAEIISSSDSIIKCTVPLSLTAKESTISVIDEGPVSVYPGKFQLTTPTISSVTPIVLFRDTITITGTGFHRDRQFNSVKIGDISASIVTSTPVKLTAIVPYTIDSMCFVSVSVSGQTAISNEKIKVKIPDFDLFEPLFASYLDTITIHCKNLHVEDITSVQFDNEPARIISASANSILIEVPTGLKKEYSDIKINFTPGEYIFNYKFHLNQPIITGLSSEKVLNQQILTIMGSGFNPVKTGNRVKLTNLNSGTVFSFFPVSSGSTSIQIKIQNPSNPALSIPSGNYNLTVGTCEESFLWGNPIEVADTWRKLSNFPGGERYKGGAFAINGKGYVGLGTKIGNDIQKDLWEFDPATEVWTRKADFPGNARIHPYVFMNNNFGYMGAGVSKDNISQAVPYNDFFKFNPASNTWTSSAPVPVSGGSYFVAYASTSSNRHIGILEFNKIFSYTEETNTWAQVYTGDAAIYAAPSIFCIGKKVYFVGGIHIQLNNGTINMVWEFDTETNTMTRKNDFPGTSRWGGFGFSIGNYGYIGGGVYKSVDNSVIQSLTDVYRYDPVNDTWTNLGTFPGGNRLATYTFVVGGKAYIVSGLNGSNFTSEVWEFYPGL